MEYLQQKATSQKANLTFENKKWEKEVRYAETGMCIRMDKGPKKKRRKKLHQWCRMIQW